MANQNLQVAKAAKKDEFYTQLSDIEKELRHYKEHFRDKVVYCNCDDPLVSNFVVYFIRNFEHLGLKRLIATCFRHKELDLFGAATVCGAEGGSEDAVYMIYEGDKNHNNALDPEELEVHPLKGNGDFRSPECVELLQQADIVCTNPPFSLFREYVAQLMKYDKKFLIVGSVNAITYKEFFSWIKQNEVWLGISIHSGDREFQIPNDYETNSPSLRIDEQGRKFVRVPGIRWFTNIDHKERHDKLVLYRKYDPNMYPKYDNFDAIDVSKVCEIPCDYYGYMGVPVNFMDTYCPEQFEIIGYGKGDTAKEIGVKKNYRGRTDLSYTKDGKVSCPYGRILIRRKQ